MRKVFVRNIPVRTCVDGWVDVPDDTPVEGLDAAITASLKEGRFTLMDTSVDVSEDTFSVEKEVLDKWEYSTPLEGA